MYHINDKDEAKHCGAKEPKNCRFYKGEDDPRHYEDADEAAKVSAALLAERHANDEGKFKRYSFTSIFKKQQEEFKERFNGVSNRFYNYDIRGKVYRGGDPNEFADRIEAGEGKGFYYYVQDASLYERMLMSLSSPADNKISDEDAEQKMAENGFTDITRMSTFRDRAWVARLGDRQVYVTDDSRYHDFANYRLRRPPEGYQAAVTAISLRSLSSIEREKRLTGKTLLKEMVVDRNSKDTDTVKQARVKLLRQLGAYENAQLEGRNFNAQTQYFRDHDPKVATAWMDKKNPDQLHTELANSTKFLGNFRKVEIDNDVDAGSFKEFENDYLNVMDQLPPVPKDRQPELRVRKLGKHKASGVFFPHKTTVCVDVHDSSSFVHEMGHYYDIAVKDNASLSDEFRDITGNYIKNLKVPEEMSGKANYYSTPTEILARGFEMYAHEKLGIQNNRLINPQRFEQFDYAPFRDNPDLKEKLYGFFDRTFPETQKGHQH